MCKKIFFLAIVLSLQISFLNFADAADVWFHKYAGDDYYAQTHLIAEDSGAREFTVPVKLVTNGRLGNNRVQLFKYSGGTWYAKYRDSSMDLEPVNANEFYSKLFDACRPYCNLAQNFPR